MHPTLQFQEKGGKPIGEPLVAANGPSPNPSRLFITDRTSKIQYLIDTGSDMSVYPRTLVRGRRSINATELFAANGSVIRTFGELTLQPDFGLRRAFPWRFVVAEVTTPIIGSDFLAFFHLLPDVRNGQLMDAKTGLKANGTTQKFSFSSVKSILESTTFHQLLARFPNITRSTGAHQEKRLHTTEHFIKTTPGPRLQT